MLDYNQIGNAHEPRTTDKLLSGAALGPAEEPLSGQRPRGPRLAPVVPTAWVPASPPTRTAGIRAGKKRPYSPQCPGGVVGRGRRRRRSGFQRGLSPASAALSRKAKKARGPGPGANVRPAALPETGAPGPLPAEADVALTSSRPLLPGVEWEAAAPTATQGAGAGAGRMCKWTGLPSQKVSGPETQGVGVKKKPPGNRPNWVKGSPGGEQKQEPRPLWRIGPEFHPSDVDGKNT
ncbi:uncharacterized protein [Notamacropus eugenii]|uniref:uncharacterized protein n=1 Tax=Notamacropus eugenii TaxID=9315 RepID=UPI003B6833D3